MLLLKTLAILFIQACFFLKESTGQIKHSDAVYIGKSQETQCDCGATNFNPGRTIGNNTVRNSREYPFLVGILYDHKIVCGGSLISTMHVLTAAHCLTRLADYDNAPQDMKKLMIKPHLDIVLNVPDKSHRLVTMGIAAYFIHPSYDSNEGEALNDIGIVRLEKPLIYKKWLKPICIADDPKMTKVGNLISVLGFGNATDIHRNTVVREIALPIKELHECRKMLKTAVLDTSICSGGVKNVDVCTGDSGGPMFYTDSQNRSYQVGIISWGDGCGREDFPAIYTRVNSFMHWIKGIISDSPSCEKLFPPKIEQNIADCGIPEKFCEGNVSKICDSGEYRYSWMARIFHKEKFLGTAVLVNRTFVLTNTRVLQWPKLYTTRNLRVILGMRSRSKQHDQLNLDSSELECTVSSVLYHPNVAQVPLVILELNISRFDTVLLHHPLCLPDPNTKQKNSYENLVLMFWKEKNIKSAKKRSVSKEIEFKNEQNKEKTRYRRHTIQESVSGLKEMVLEIKKVQVVNSKMCFSPSMESRAICGVMKGKKKCHGNGAILMNYVGGRFFMVGFVSPRTKRCSVVKNFITNFIAVSWNYTLPHDTSKKMENI